MPRKLNATSAPMALKLTVSSKDGPTEVRFYVDLKAMCDDIREALSDVDRPEGLKLTQEVMS